MGGNSKISTTAHEEGKLKAAPPAVICIGSSTECLRIENLKIDKIVMFGAGASAGCGKVYPYDPPTGTKLYSKLLDEFPKTWGRIPDDLKATFKKELRMDLMIFGTTTQRYMRI